MGRREYPFGPSSRARSCATARIAHFGDARRRIPRPPRSIRWAPEKICCPRPLLTIDAAAARPTRMPANIPVPQSCANNASECREPAPIQMPPLKTTATVHQPRPSMRLSSPDHCSPTFCHLMNSREARSRCTRLLPLRDNARAHASCAKRRKRVAQPGSRAPPRLPTSICIHFHLLTLSPDVTRDFTYRTKPMTSSRRVRPIAPLE